MKTSLIFKILYELMFYSSTKSQYTWAEKEAMLRYVVDNKQYNRVKGKQIYKDMEAANVSLKSLLFTFFPL